MGGGNTQAGKPLKPAPTMGNGISNISQTPPQGTFGLSNLISGKAEQHL